MRFINADILWTREFRIVLGPTCASDPHLYFQTPGGQCLRLVGIDEDLSFYEGAADGPNVAKVKEALNKEAVKN